jgi:PAS domain S-box-containing protein
MHPGDLERIRREFAQIVQSGEESEMEFRILRPDAAMRWIRWRGQVMRDATAGSSRAVGVVMDITDRKRSEETIATLVQQVRADSSENFFSSMACQLCKCLGADYTIIAELVGGEVEKAKTVAVCQHGMPADNFTYELAGTPCAGVMRQSACSYVSGVAGLFPADRLLKEMGIEGYTGTPLFSSQGRAIGIMLALYTRPLDDPRFAESILQLFSARTAAEIERNRTEEALSTSEERLRVALKNAPIKVFNQDRELRYTWAHNLSGRWAETDFLGKTDEDIFKPETAARMKALKQAVLETGEGKREVFPLAADGAITYWDVTVEPLRDAAGKVVGVNLACMDVTHLERITEDLRQATEKLAEEKFYLEQEIDTELGFEEIVGKSVALKQVMEQVGKVATSDATVLLLGETGTGKELVARALHRLGRRAGNSFIKMNCAAIPTGLLESELFGYEKGAFTGAIGKKLGRLELADKGTLFLDEIGEIPLALQPKLLRVLQDQEFERLGGTQTLKVDFRLIAATNRDLADSVKKGEFRSDLYYRLNVFPVRVPPLRERREDIRLLVEHFVQKCAKRMNRRITSIPKKTIDALTGWDWPGNVRELENFVERSVILTHGSVLVSPLSELKPLSEGAMNETLEAAEREHILRALRESHGKVGGPRGAAARLGLKRTTLQSKLKQMGIDRRPPMAGH